MQSKNTPAKFIDVLMQEKDYNIHLDRLSRISNKQSTKAKTSRTRDNIYSLDQYLKQFSDHKDLLKQRNHSKIQQQNQQLASRLIQIGRPSVRYGQNQPEQEKRFHSFWRSKQVDRQRRSSNMQLVKRLMSTESFVPSRQSLKKQYKQHKKYRNNLKKFPVLVSYHSEAKRKLSQSKV